MREFVEAPSPSCARRRRRQASLPYPERGEGRLWVARRLFLTLPSPLWGEGGRDSGRVRGRTQRPEGEL